MVVEASSTPNLMDDMDDDDDEEPIVFKRSSSSARQNQSNGDRKKLSSPSQKHGTQPVKQISDARPANGQSSMSHSSRIATPVKTSSSKSQLSSAVASTSSAKEQNSGTRPAIGQSSMSQNGRTATQAKASSAKSQLSSPEASTSSAKGQISGMRSANGQSTMSQNGRIATPATATSAKSLLSSPEASTSSAKGPQIKSSTAKSNPSAPSTAKANQLNPQKSSSSVKETKPSIQSAAGSESDSEDSDDGKPLSSRIPIGLSKGSSDHCNKVVEKSSSGQNSSIKKEKDESEDEKPPSIRYHPNSNNRESKCVPGDSDEIKPLAAKRVQNGSALRDGQVNKSSTVSSKRPPNVVKSSAEPPAKKAKLVDACTPSNGKSAPVKAETKTKEEEEDDDDDDDDHIPISQRIKSSSSVNASPAVKKVTKVVSSSLSKTNQKSKKIIKNTTKYSKSSTMLPSSGEGKKWTTLIHNGVIFPPPYKPHRVKMLYKKQPVDLTPEQEEVATMFAVMLETDYMNKPRFRENFFNDWKKILGKNHVIQNLDDCDFTPIYEWHQREKEKKKQMTTDEKKALKEEKLRQEEKYMWAILDGTKERVGNFRVEPPGLFRGRGEHPKMGKLKRRIRPSDITINIGKNAPVPECPIPGERWKEVRHDNTVTWLAFWNDPINPKEFKYVFLAASSTLKGQSDKEKYEKARKLKDYIQDIRKAYTKDFTSKDSTKKQIAVATYLIDKLALRAGNEKDDDEADTVGCCTLKVENVDPVPPNTLKFDFLGKDSIRYQNEVKVERPVFEAIQQFRKGKKDSDDLFDELDTSKLNAHLKELMPGLTAKVFRTYNASITLDDMLSKETRGEDVTQKVVVYQHANKEVAIICNHQRTVSKSHSAQIGRLDEKIGELKAVLEELQDDLSRINKGKQPSRSADGKPKRNLNPESLERKIAQTNAKIEKMERDKETKEDLKTVALGTSKINYLDPRITVAWCKRHEVPIEKIFNKSLLAKFAWAMDVDPSFRF